MHHEKLKINVSGVVLQRQDVAKEELYKQFKHLCNELETDIELIVTSVFDQTVDSILRKKRGCKHKYISKREHVVAIAKTIPYLIDRNIEFLI